MKKVLLFFFLTAFVGFLLISCSQTTRKNGDLQMENIDNATHKEKIKKNELSKTTLFYHATYMMNGSADAIDWLKKNSPSLFHHATYMVNGSADAIDWLKENNPSLFHHATYMMNGSANSLDWLKE